jgi:hypothetical protein
MVTVLGDHEEVVVQGCRRNEDVSITDELASLIQQGVNIRGADDDGIRQRQHMTAPTLLLETRQLADGVAGLEAS